MELGRSPPCPEWVAAQDTPDRQPRAADGSVRSDRVLREVAAARVETALSAEHTRRTWPDTGARARSAARAPELRSATSPRARSSVPRSVQEFGHLAHQILALGADDRRPRHQDRVAPVTVCSTWRQASRSTRRARLRWTAPPTRFPAITATRSAPGARNTMTRSPRAGRPASRIRLISRERTVRRFRRSDGQTSAALATPSREDRPARARAHAVTETVHLCTAAVVGLEGTFALGHG